MLKRLHIDNFKCLANFELAPGPVSVVVGPNGGGKSTLFQALRAIQGVLGGGEVKVHFPPWSRTRWDSRNGQRIELEVSIDGETFLYLLEINQPPDSFGIPRIHDERLQVDGAVLYRLTAGQVQLFGDDASEKPRTTFPFAPVRSFLPLLEPRADNKRLFKFLTWMSGVWLFSLSPHIEVFSEGEDLALNASGFNFISWYRTLVQESPDVVEMIRKDLEPVIPGLTGVRLRTPGGPTTKSLHIECSHGKSKHEYTVHELSDGQRMLLMLYSILRALPHRASLMVFDEPDNFLAQQEIQPWLSLLRDAATQDAKTTLVVISHHPEVVDYLAPDQTLYLWREKDGPTRVREMSFDRASGLTASELLRLESSNGQ